MGPSHLPGERDLVFEPLTAVSSKSDEKTLHKRTHRETESNKRAGCNHRSGSGLPSFAPLGYTGE